jgi:hypothetical protein
LHRRPIPDGQLIGSSGLTTNGISSQAACLNLEQSVATWIGFDDASIAILTKRKKNQVEIGIGDPLDVALQAEAPAMVILNGSGAGVQVITIGRKARTPLKRGNQQD